MLTPRLSPTTVAAAMVTISHQGSLRSLSTIEAEFPILKEPIYICKIVAHNSFQRSFDLPNNRVNPLQLDEYPVTQP